MRKIMVGQLVQINLHGDKCNGYFAIVDDYYNARYEEYRTIFIDKNLNERY